ncbi:MAG: YggS family pyridoxal phosphate-dependent enzyme [Pseudomonadota bacterium]
MPPGQDPDHSLAARLAALDARIRAACRQAGRPDDACRLLAVAKTRSAAEIAALAALGCRDIGENYVQEALPKMDALAGRGLRWHLIGPLQSNKTREVAARFDWVHSLDREKIARRLNDQRPDDRPPLDVCLQVNIDDEGSKAGVPPAALPELAQAVLALPRLRLRGLMTIPRPDQPAGAGNAYARLAALRQSLESVIAGPSFAGTIQPARHPAAPALDTLSMGMSDDFELAIAHGATWVRIGTALFGPRERVNA